MRLSLPLLFIVILLSIAGHAQSPPGINYQGVARNLDGKPLALKDITIKINILKDGESGPVEYSERHSLKTNSFGLFTLVIGTGESITGDFAFISWAMGNKWLRVEMDPEGGSSFQLMGSQQFMSVPYAFYAKYSGNSLTPGQGISITNNVITNTGDADNNSSNELNTAFTLSPDRKLRITDSGGTKEVDLSSLSTNPIVQDLSLSGDNLSITGNPSATNIDLAPYLDNTDAQSLTLTGSTLGISGGNNVNLAPFMDNTDSQALTLTGSTLGISGGNNVNLAPFMDNTDSQNLSLAGATLSIAGGNSVNLSALAAPQNLGSTSAGTTRTITITGGASTIIDVADNDNNPGNELQDLSLNSATHTLNLSSDATPVSLAPYLDNTDNQQLTLLSHTLSLTNDATPIDLTPYLDDTDAQTLALAGSNLTIANGNTVNLAGFLDNTDSQDLSLTGNSLSLTGDATPVNLAPYLDNTDNQSLSVLPSGTNRTISISGGTGVTFSVADGDSDQTNEIQSLTFTPATRNLSISMGNSVTINETQNISQVLTQGNDAGGQRLTNLGAPSVPSDAVTKQYVDDADNAINARLSQNYAFKTSFTFSTLLSGGSNIALPLAGESFDDFNVVNSSNFTAQAAGTYVFTIDGDISSLLVGSAISVLYNGTKYPVSVGSNNRYNTTLMFRLTVGQTVSLVADGIGIATNINGTFFGYKLP